jgi:hypothetical protein
VALTDVRIEGQLDVVLEIRRGLEQDVGAPAGVEVMESERHKFSTA